MLADLSSLAEVLDRSERADGGVEEGQQVDDEHVVEEQLAVTVGLFLTQLIKLLPQQPDVLPSDDLLRPVLHALRIIASTLRHNGPQSGRSLCRAQMKNRLKFSRTALGEASGTRFSKQIDSATPPSKVTDVAI